MAYYIRALVMVVLRLNLVGPVHCCESGGDTYNLFHKEPNDSEAHGLFESVGKFIPKTECDLAYFLKVFHKLHFLPLQKLYVACPYSHLLFGPQLQAGIALEKFVFEG